MIDFTAYRNPVLAVACPYCGAKRGSSCKRPSEHRTWNLHADRKKLADKLFIEQHGERASIEETDSGWVITGGGV